MQTQTASPYQEIPVTALFESTWNPRKHYDASKLEELAASVREKGVIEPIVVRAILRKGGNVGKSTESTPIEFEILAGSRRFRASKIAGLESVPAVIRQLDDVAALELAIIENQQRDDVHPLDEAEGYRALMKADKAYTAAVVATKVGKPQPYIFRRLKLLDLEPELMKALADDRLSVSHAEKLLRLTPALRKEAAHAENGVVWRHNPLLDGTNGKWIPQREDLRPLNELEAFIRTRSHFDPKTEASRHLQPELAEQLEQAIDEEFTDTTDTPEAVDGFVASLIELSVDPMARMRLKAKPNEKIPLTPSQWRAIKGDKDRCEFTQRGVVTHGGPTAILEICTKRSCSKHFPVAKKKKATAATTSTRESAAQQQERWRREEERREADRKAWETLRPKACRALAAKIGHVKFSAALVREVLDTNTLKAIETNFGLVLTEKDAATVLLLATIDNLHNRPYFEPSVRKRFKFDVTQFEKNLEAAAAKSPKAAAAKPGKKPTAKAAKTAKAGARKAARKK